MVDPVAVYSNVGTRFGLVDTEHPGGHHGQDFRLPNGGGSVIPAYEECVVVESGVEVTRGFTAILGWYVVAKSTRDGRYMGWAHLRRGTRPAVGAVLKPGDQVGLAANGPRPSTNLSPAVAGIDYPGTAWTAPHIHTTVSTTIPGIFAGPTSDPLPRIQAALVSLAGSGPLTRIDQEEDDMLADERAALFAIQKALGTIYDTVTPGVQGVKFDGDLYGRVKGVQTALADIASKQVGYGARVEAVQTALTDVAAKQVGYGRRVEIIQDTLLPRVLDAIAADEVKLTDEQIATLTGALSSAGIIARLDDATLKQVGSAAADEEDRRAKARLNG